MKCDVYIACLWAQATPEGLLPRSLLWWRLCLAVVALICLDVRAQDPGWTVDPSRYELTMSAIAVVALEGEPLQHPAARLAALDAAGQVRGVASPIALGTGVRYFLTLHGNAAGEVLTLHAYNPATLQVRVLSPAVTFQPNGILGSIAEPSRFTAATTPDGPVASPEWSVDPSLYAATMNVVARVTSGNGTASQRANDELALIDSGGRVRGLAIVQPDGRGGYVAFMTGYGNSSGEVLSWRVRAGGQEFSGSGSIRFEPNEVLGSIFEPIEVAIALGAFADPLSDPTLWQADPTRYEHQMTLVGRVVQGANTLSGATVRVAAYVGNEIRGVASPQLVSGEGRVFLTVYGRSGERVRFRVAVGDVTYSVENIVSFTPNASLGSVMRPVLLRVPGAIPQELINPILWSVLPSRFEGTMSAVASFQTTQALPEGSRLTVLSNGEVRGVASPIPVGGATLFFLTVYGQEGESLAFQAYDAQTGRVFASNDTRVFSTNAVEGRLADPVRLTSAGQPISLFVLPGDANNNGQVDQNDVLPVGFYFGLNGPARAQRSNAFTRQIVQSWTPLAASTTDVNGDGRINQNDVLPIAFNFGRSRDAQGFRLPSIQEGAVASSLLAQSRATGSPLRIDLRANRPIYAPGDTVLLRVYVASPGPEGVRGLGFQVAYDTTAFVPLRFLPGEVGGEGALSFFRIERRIGRVAFAFGWGGATRLEEGRIVTLPFVVRPAARQAYTFSLEEAEAMDSHGDARDVSSVPLSISVSSQPTSSTGTVGLSFGVDALWPLPARDKTSVSVSALLPFTVALYDVAGREVGREPITLAPGMHVLDITTAHLPAGLYLLRLQDAGGAQIIRKIPVIR